MHDGVEDAAVGVGTCLGQGMGFVEVIVPEEDQGQGSIVWFGSEGLEG